MPRGIPASGARVNRADDRRKLRPAIIDPHQFYSVPETAAARDESVATTYAAIAAGTLKPTRVGKRTKVLGAEIIRANQSQAAA